jgi:hypothetical protein
MPIAAGELPSMLANRLKSAQSESAPEGRDLGNAAV